MAVLPATNLRSKQRGRHWPKSALSTRVHQVPSAVSAVININSLRAARSRLSDTLALAVAIFVTTVLTAPCGVAAPAFQYVRSESGRLRCDVHPDNVVCEASGPDSTGFPQAPITLPESQCRNPCPGGIHQDLAVVTPSGALHWDDGNIGGGGTPQNDLVLSYGQTFHILGWTILPSSDGTRFTNDATGHGMFVSVENVSSF